MESFASCKLISPKLNPIITHFKVLFLVFNTQAWGKKFKNEDYPLGLARKPLNISKYYVMQPITQC